MFNKLHQDDAQAVDLLLQDGVNADRSNVTQCSDAAVNRVALVDSVLRIFGEMPAAEPPHDLVSKTLVWVNVSVLAQGTVPDLRPFNS